MKNIKIERISYNRYIIILDIEYKNIKIAEEKKLPEQLFGFGTGPAKITFGQKSTPGWLF